MSQAKGSRKQQILETLAHMLENNPGNRISIAQLAKSVGVSEAALYRHFPSKTKMFESLLTFAEEAVLTRAAQLASDTTLNAHQKLERMLYILLLFCERNPGITRLLTGDAISGETERLHAQVRQFFDKFTTEMRQLLRKAELEEGLSLPLSIQETVLMLSAQAEGRIARFVRSQFNDAPSENWQHHWQLLAHTLIQHKEKATG